MVRNAVQARFSSELSHRGGPMSPPYRSFKFEPSLNRAVSGWSGLSDTALVAAGGAVLALLGRVVTGTASVPLAAGIFTLVL